MENSTTSVEMPFRAKKGALQFSSVMRGPIISGFTIDNSQSIQTEAKWASKREINKEETSDDSECSETSDSESEEEEEGILLLASSRYEVRSQLLCVSHL